MSHGFVNESLSGGFTVRGKGNFDLSYQLDKGDSRIFTTMALDLIHPPIQWEMWLISPSLKR